MATREGVCLAQDLHLTRVKMASDCMAVVKALAEPNLGSYCHILQDIKTCVIGFIDATFVHENRASNKEPHDLARLASSSPVG